MNSPATSWAGPTAERILEAAHKLFSEVGFDATKMESVARAARISRPTLYGYYRSKEELYQAVLAREGALLQRKMAGIDLAGDPVAVLRSFIGMLFDEFVAGAHFSIIDIKLHKGIRVPRSAVISGAAHREILELVLQRGKDAGIFAQNADSAMFQATTVALLSGFASSREVLPVLTGAEATSAEAIAHWREHLADVLIASIRHP